MNWLPLLIFCVPVALAALGETIAQKSGVINIGLEGTMLMAAFIGMLTTFTTHSVALGLVAGSLAGMLTTLAFGFFVVRLAADQVVVGTAVNLLAMGVTGTLYRARFGQSGQLISLPKLPILAGIDPVTMLCFGLAPGVAWLLNRTAWGLAVRAAGEYPKSAEAAGFSVRRLRMSALALAGLLGGLGGAYLSLGVANSFSENMTTGRGFVAIAIVTFGRWRPAWVLAAAILIGLIDSLQYRFQALGIHVPFQLMLAMPYLVSLAVLVLVGKGTRAPGALGQPYQESA